METSKVLILLVALRSVTDGSIEEYTVPLYKHGHRYGNNNQYFCHCASDEVCNRRNGECSVTHGKCSEGWFGPSCQFLALNFSVDPPSGDMTWLSDQDINTCNRQPGSSLSFSLEVNQVVSWLRLEFNDEEVSERKLEMKYSLVSGVHQPCPGDQWENRGSKTEIFCPSSKQVGSITLKGLDLAKLCNIYIARGKNVGLGAAARQSSDYIRSSGEALLAKYAIDGTLDKSEAATGCAHTMRDPFPPWIQITLDPPEDVFSFTVYNRKSVCPTNKYGKNCNQDCGLCRDDQCNPFLGVCLNGCGAPGLVPPRCVDCREPGKTGRRCDQDCPSGTYGLGCAEKCPTTCLKELCTPNNGKCLKGCVSGYTGEKCEKHCPSGTFGLGCAEKCPTTCIKKLCTPNNGTCLKGCVSGYTGEKCENHCISGTYGLGCAEKCPTTCLKGLCTPNNGTCVKGCVSGYTGEICEKPCPQGTYGPNCAHECYTCKGANCSSIDGNCDEGCIPGYLGEMCEHACPNETYGDQCGQQCGMCAENTTCDNVNGACAEGCWEGYIEPFCDAKSQTESRSKLATHILYILPLALLLVGIIAYLASPERQPPQNIATKEADTEREDDTGDSNKKSTDTQGHSSEDHTEPQIQEEQRSGGSPVSSESSNHG